MRRLIIVLVAVPLVVFGALASLWGRNDLIGCGHGAYWLGTIALLEIPGAALALALAFAKGRAGAGLGVVVAAGALLVVAGSVRVAALGEEDRKRLLVDESPRERARLEQTFAASPPCVPAGLEACGLPLAMSLAAVGVGFMRRRAP